MDKYYTIKWLDGEVRMIDQRLLPKQEVYLTLTSCAEVSEAIKNMVIRGAPAIGASAGFGMALAAMNSIASDVECLMDDLRIAANILISSRPTAINLNWAIQRVLEEALDSINDGVLAIKNRVVATAIKIAEEDVIINRRIGQMGASLIPDGANIIHHCNTGALATVGYGTALGVVRYAHESGKKIHVYVDETRPRLQGARLTSWELSKLKIPHTVIVDGASGYFMKSSKIDLCLVGCDRIALNGDVANKIGTYNLALVAQAHGVPFYCVGPISSLDQNSKTGEEIPIEERSPDEITHIGNEQITPYGVQAANPAFDITPAKYITGIITEKGIAISPYHKSFLKLMIEKEA